METICERSLSMNNPLTVQQWQLVLNLCQGDYIRLPSEDNPHFDYQPYLALARSTNAPIPWEDFNALRDKKLIVCKREDHWWSVWEIKEDEVKT